MQVYDQRIVEVTRTNEIAQRLLAVWGIGRLIATDLLVLAGVADANELKSGRALSANLGLVPSEHMHNGSRSGKNAYRGAGAHAIATSPQDPEPGGTIHPVFECSPP